MATVHVTFRNAVMAGGSSIPSATPRAAETITSSGTSQATTITALEGEIATITAVGGAVWIAIDDDPTAASGVGDLVPDGARVDLGLMTSGHAVAVLDA